ncbi:hypothetical protein [Asanoa iriomotensis]|uniref:Uncharacterized protein n=1 Tax=Asanoa iriomotensis TaxID=234613 RepID=A0ABQ4C278_9ACTN|nr:hypothetical protein [Asanoa iriomotensis]GIF56883.1 hypothetical protein Air01nite_29780 [Asanoa iriomotensis]
MSLEEEPTGELPGLPEDNPVPGEEPTPEAIGSEDTVWLGGDRTAPRRLTSRADKRRNQRR